MGLMTLPSPDQAIQNPWFTLMEILILAIAPAMVGFTVGLHDWASAERKPLAVLSVIFMSMCPAVTCCVHFAVLTLSRHPAFAGPEWTVLAFSFRWPSVVYALDILAWDLFFPLATLFAALAVHFDPEGRMKMFILFITETSKISSAECG
jgi:predicted Abi (CAAX) family protease